MLLKTCPSMPCAGCLKTCSSTGRNPPPDFCASFIEACTPKGEPDSIFLSVGFKLPDSSRTFQGNYLIDYKNHTTTNKIVQVLNNLRFGFFWHRSSDVKLS